MIISNDTTWCFYSVGKYVWCILRLGTILMVLVFVGSLSLARPSCQATNWLSGRQKRDGSDNDLNTAQDYQDMSILLSGSMFAWYPWVLFHCWVFQWALCKIHFWPELISISFTSDHLAACVKSSPTNSERLMPPCKLGFNEAKAAWGHWDYVDLSQFTKVPEGSIKSSALWLMKDCGTKAQNPGLLAGVASFSAGIALHRIRPWKSQSEKLPQNHGTSISTLELCDPEEKQSTSWLSTLLKTAGAGCIIGAASRKVHKYRRAYRAKAEKFPCASKMAKGLLDPLDETTGESELDEVDRKTRRRVRQVVLILSPNCVKPWWKFRSWDRAGFFTPKSKHAKHAGLCPRVRQPKMILLDWSLWTRAWKKKALVKWFCPSCISSRSNTFRRHPRFRPMHLPGLLHLGGSVAFHRWMSLQKTSRIKTMQVRKRSAPKLQISWKNRQERWNWQKVVWQLQTSRWMKAVWKILHCQHCHLPHHLSQHVQYWLRLVISSTCRVPRTCHLPRQEMYNRFIQVLFPQGQKSHHVRWRHLSELSPKPFNHLPLPESHIWRDHMHFNPVLSQVLSVLTFHPAHHLDHLGHLDLSPEQSSRCQVSLLRQQKEPREHFCPWAVHLCRKALTSRNGQHLPRWTHQNLSHQHHKQHGARMSFGQVTPHMETEQSLRDPQALQLDQLQSNQYNQRVLLQLLCQAHPCQAAKNFLALGWAHGHQAADRLQRRLQVGTNLMDWGRHLAACNPKVDCHHPRQQQVQAVLVPCQHRVHLAFPLEAPQQVLRMNMRCTLTRVAADRLLLNAKDVQGLIPHHEAVTQGLALQTAESVAMISCQTFQYNAHPEQKRPILPILPILRAWEPTKIVKMVKACKMSRHCKPEKAMQKKLKTSKSLKAPEGYFVGWKKSGVFQLCILQISGRRAVSPNVSPWTCGVVLHVL